MARKLPQRTCLGCQSIRPKREMIRIVRTSEGVLVDPTGKLAGRGAYVCADLGCLEKLRKSKRLDRALAVSAPPSIFEMLKERIESIIAQKGTE